MCASWGANARFIEGVGVCTVCSMCETAVALPASTIMASRKDAVMAAGRRKMENPRIVKVVRLRFAFLVQ
jgi:hypothetical protein